MPFLSVKSKLSCFSLAPNSLTASGHLSTHAGAYGRRTAAQYSVSLLLQAFISLSTQIRSRSLPNMFLSLGFDACREDWVEHFVYGRLSVDFTEFYRYKVWNQETVMVFKHATIQCMSSWWNKTLYFARYVSPILLWLKCGAGDVLDSRGQGWRPAASRRSASLVSRARLSFSYN